MKTLLSMPNNLKKIFLSGLVMFAVVTSGISQCTNTAAWSTETAPTVPNSATIYGQYAGEYGTWLSLVAGTQYVITSSIVTDYLTVRQGTPGGTAVAYGVQPLTYTATTSGTYYIHCNVSLLCDAQSAARDITMTAVSSSAPGPANEQCSGAIAVAIPSSTSGTTVGAQPEAPAPPTCITTYDNSNGVWYTVTGTGNPITASLCGSGWDSKLHVYTGSCGTFTCVTGNDDLGPACSTSDASVRWCSVSGTTYYILVSGYSTYSGAFTLTMSQLVLTPAITPTSPSVCTGNSITLTATGPGTFTWNPGSGSGANFTVSPTATTTYTCTATDAASGCTGTATVSVSVNPSPTVTVTPSS
ncbi:MAG TPA: hypothetical protein VI731_00450, partial [Bacteroidia bacterium]|nr:hypothetical protein [Bacteroidia bacterium]